MAVELKYWAWLSSISKISVRKKLALLKYFGDPAILWDASEAELRKLNFCTPGIIEAIIDRQCRRNAPAIVETAHRCGADIITINDIRYPELLRNIADPPIVLYCRGKLEKSDICVAVVGSRKATAYGLDVAGKLSHDMAKNGVTVVSGMARGIDSKAHVCALESGGRTIAVLGCGVDIAYPNENRSLMERICRSGAVISEFLPGTKPVPFNFPARNRIISGLSMGVVIVEAGERSGSLITADLALDQGRDVFAVPGNINCINSLGANRLIRDGARLITNAAEILDELGICHGECEVMRMKKQMQLDLLGKEELTISKRLLEGPAHIDTIARDCGLSAQLTGSVLLMLELSGFVEQLPGKYYKIVE